MNDHDFVIFVFGFVVAAICAGVNKSIRRSGD